MLCSDGLTDMVDTDIVHGIVDEHRASLDVAAAQLIELANQNGGRDNISVVLAHVPPSVLPERRWAQNYLDKKRKPSAPRP
jgi:protein phosphatase